MLKQKVGVDGDAPLKAGKGVGLSLKCPIFIGNAGGTAEFVF
jgi:hypothetical protein